MASLLIHYLQNTAAIYEIYLNIVKFTYKLIKDYQTYYLVYRKIQIQDMFYSFNVYSARVPGPHRIQIYQPYIIELFKSFQDIL